MKNEYENRGFPRKSPTGYVTNEKFSLGMNKQIPFENRILRKSLVAGLTSESYFLLSLHK